MKFDKNDTLAIKGLAILFMIQHHNFCSFERFASFEVTFLPFDAAGVVTFSNFLKICVGMYVFLSGYGLTFSLKKYSPEYRLSGIQYRDFIFRRLFKLMAGFWAIYLIFFTVSMIVNLRPTNIYYAKGDGFTGTIAMLIDLSGLAYLFGTPTINGTWWYMTLAIFIIIITPFLARLSKKYGIFLAMLLCIFIPRLITFGVQFSVDASANISRWFFAILLGIACAQYDVFARVKGFRWLKKPFWDKLLKLFVYTGILVLLYFARIVLHEKGYSSIAYELTDNIIPMYVVYYCYEFLTDIPGLRKVLIFVGKHSMNIFLLHTFIRLYLLQDLMYSVNYFLLITLFVLVTSLAISVVIELLKKVTRWNKLVNYVDQKIAARLSERNMQNG